MAINGYIGQPIVFQILYLDNTGAPFAPTNPNISVFRFDDSTASKISIINTQPMAPADPAEVGRYTYRWIMDPNLSLGMILYVEYRAVDPISGNTLVVKDVVNVYSFEVDDFLVSRFG